MSGRITKVIGIVAFVALQVPTMAQARCTEEFPIVGRSTCRRFGSWELMDLPRLQINVGTSVHWFPLDGASVTGMIDKTHSLKLPSAGLSNVHVTAVTFDWGPTGFVAGPLYVGPRVQVGPSFLSGSPPASAGYQLNSRTGFYFGGGLVLGVELPLRSLLPLSIRIEALGGGRLVSVIGQNGSSTAALEAGVPTNVTVNASSWMLEPRLAVDYWMNPWLSLGLFGGKSVIHQGEGSIGLTFSAHMMPFDVPASAW